MSITSIVLQLNLIASEKDSKQAAKELADQRKKDKQEKYEVKTSNESSEAKNQSSKQDSFRTPDYY